MTAPWVLDTDPAIGYLGRDVDDAYALFAMLAEPSISLEAVTVVFGNTSQPKAHAKAQELLQRLQKTEIPVYAGAHGPRNLGIQTPASRALQEAARRHAGDLCVLAIGPMTNVATAAQDPDFLPALKQLVLLGGTLSAPSRHTQRQGFEFNFRQDLPAARALLKAPRLTIFPMEVCRQLQVGPSAWKQLYQRGGEARWLATQSLLWALLSPFVWGSIGFHPWDILPALSIGSPDPFVYEEQCITIGPSGELLEDPTQGANAKIAVSVDKVMFWERFWRVFDVYSETPSTHLGR